MFVLAMLSSRDDEISARGQLIHIVEFGEERFVCHSAQQVKHEVTRNVRPTFRQIRLPGPDLPPTHIFVATVSLWNWDPHCTEFRDFNLNR